MPARTRCLRQRTLDCGFALGDRDGHGAGVSIRLLCVGLARLGYASSGGHHGCAPPIACDLISIRISPDIGGIFLHSTHRRYPRVYRLRIRPCAQAGLPENRGLLSANGKLVFNIRISTEDEINGTVKWVV